MAPREILAALPGVTEALMVRGCRENIMDSTRTTVHVDGNFFLLKHQYAHVEGMKTYAVWGEWCENKFVGYCQMYDFTEL